VAVQCTLPASYGTAAHRHAMPCQPVLQRDGTARHGTARHGAAQHGTARHGAAWHGMARHSAARRGTHGTAQHGMGSCLFEPMAHSFDELDVRLPQHRTLLLQ
jgi:hypothetical protein